jgi:nucleoside-triphosphatase
MDVPVRFWLVTGDPGIGKTSCVYRVIKSVKRRGYTVGGVVSGELRASGGRIGFEMVDLKTENRFVLASTDLDAGPKLGRYRVNLKGLAEVGAQALRSSLVSADLTVCDEIGPMELLSPEFRRAVEALSVSNRPVLGAIHKRLRDPLLTRIKSAGYARLFELTFANRDLLPDQIALQVIGTLSDLEDD